MEQLFYEDVQVGAEIPPVERAATTEQLVRYHAAAGDWDRIHFDYPYARSVGFPDVILQGMLKAGWLAQMIIDWAGPKIWVKKFGTQYRQIDVPLDRLICKGKVTNKYLKGSEHLVELEVWTQNGKGEITTRGAATVRFPARTY
jgi:acyl dehydratase